MTPSPHQYFSQCSPFIALISWLIPPKTNWNKQSLDVTFFWYFLLFFHYSLLCSLWYLKSLYYRELFFKNRKSKERKVNFGSPRYGSSCTCGIRCRHVIYGLHFAGVWFHTLLRDHVTHESYLWLLKWIFCGLNLRFLSWARFIRAKTFSSKTFSSSLLGSKQECHLLCSKHLVVPLVPHAFVAGIPLGRCWCRKGGAATDTSQMVCAW